MDRALSGAQPVPPASGSGPESDRLSTRALVPEFMYQGGSDDFLGPTEDVPFASEDFGIDLEAEVAIVTDDVPMDVSREQAREHVKLVMLVNDWSLRNLIPAELAKGFGFFQSKPATSFSPVAVTPDELGTAWDGGKVNLPLVSRINGALLGEPNAGIDMVSVFHRPFTEFGTYYLLVATGYFLGNWGVTRHHGRLGIDKLITAGILISVLGSAAALGAVALGAVHPLWIFLPMAVVTFGQGLTLPNVTASAVGLARQHAGTASSLLGFVQQALGAVAVQWIGTYPVDTPYPVLIFCAATCAVAVALWSLMPRSPPTAADSRAS